MSDYRAIADVSSSLRALLLSQMEEPVTVTIAPPDRVMTLDDLTGSRLNLYLYHISEDSTLKNQEILGQGHPGAYGHPPLSLNLHYLVTAYGDPETSPDADRQAQQILGDAMRVLHDFALLPHDVLTPNLAGAFERVKVTLQPTNLDDLSKLWTALPEANFRRSVAYDVSVVQIESQRPRRFPRLVGEPPPAGPRMYALPFRSPQIQDILLQRQDEPLGQERRFAYARIGDTLILRGQNFVSDTTRVFLGAIDATAEILSLRNTRIDVTLPDHPQLQPGAQTVRVVQDVEMGDPPQPHLGFQSNLAVFVLIPHITALTPNLLTPPRTLQITGTRLFQSDQSNLTLVGDTVISAANYTTSSSTTIQFNLPEDMGSGSYRVRVRVSGAESLDDAILTIPP